jgi:phosphodiesterase/alkaline phosphatase D-like protein
MLAAGALSCRPFELAGLSGSPAHAAQTDWDAGELFHVLPSVNHERALLKCSFDAPLNDAPELHIDGRRIAGQRTDTRGQFWAFDANALRPSTTYRLEIVSGTGRALVEPWPISTFPDPMSDVTHVRIAFFSCAGGHDAIAGISDKKPIAVRRALLDKAVSLSPHAIIANGDHVYWDLWSPRLSPRYGSNETAVAYAGRFDRTKPIFGTENEDFVLKASVEQIAPLYRNACRSVPVFFVKDDHDYFDNDDATDEIITFPPNHAMLRLARAVQKLAYPEFLPDANRPLGLAGTRADEGRPEISSNYGTLRYGKLLEILLYDTRRTGTMHGPSAVFVEPEVETWLKARMRDPAVTHVVNAPSLPLGWTKGNWYDWYPDLTDDGPASVAKPKPYWQTGWLSQHDRLIEAMQAMGGRIPLIVSGDIHASAHGSILRSGAMDFSANPVVTMLPGALGTGTGFHTDARHPNHLDARNEWGLIGENGFMVADFYADRVDCTFYTWDGSTQTMADISGLEASYRTTLQPAG